jgi:hypothetical protein
VARAASQPTRQAVQCLDVGAGDGEHGRVRTTGPGSPPLAHHGPAGLDSCLGKHDAAVAGIGLDGLGGRAGAQLGQGRPLPGFALASVLGELGGLQRLGQSAESSPGLDLGDLAVVANEH